VTDLSRFGVFLPSYIWAGDGAERANGIKEFAREVEDLGFDSLFITDHLFAAKRFYSVSFLEPVAALERPIAVASCAWMELRRPEKQSARQTHALTRAKRRDHKLTVMNVPRFDRTRRVKPTRDQVTTDATQRRPQHYGPREHVVKH